MLRGATKETQPAAVGCPHRKDHDQEPVTGEDERGGERKMANENKPSPVTVLAAEFLVVRGQNMLIPVPVNAASRTLKMSLHAKEETLGIPRKKREPEFPVFETELLGKDDLAIVILVDGNLVVPHVTGAEPYVITPTDE